MDINFKPFPNLTADRLCLRQLNMEDAHDFFSIRSNETVMRFMDRPMTKNIEDTREFIKSINAGIDKNESITWGVKLKNDTRLIGTIGFTLIYKEHYRAEIGYILHPDFHGKGIMREAMTRVLSYGFDDLKLHSIEANVNPGNTSSIKLLERNNFVREAYFRENYYFEGNFLDTAIYSLLCQKYEKIR